MAVKNTNQRNRILALDLLRGFFLLVILADHLRWTPSFFFQFITAYTGMFASAAEGFFAISGILVGYIYGPKIATSTKRVVLKIWKRGLLLYILSVVFTVLYTLWAFLLPEGYPRESTPIASSLYNGIIGALSLTYSYGWADFLSRYAVFMLFAPFALWLIAKSRAYIVLILSVLIWLLFRELDPWLTFAAWQIVFYFGVVIGYYLPKIEHEATKTEQRQKYTKRLVYISIASFIAITLIASIVPLLILGFDIIINNTVTSFIHQINSLREHLLIYFEKATMSIFRIALGTLWFFGLFCIFRQHEKRIDKITRGSLLLLGTHSLLVYCLEALLVFSIDTLYLGSSTAKPSFILYNTLFGFICAAIIYYTVYLYANRSTLYTRLRRLISKKL